MPLGSQEGDTRPQALEVLKTEGRESTITLRELALELEALLAENDNAGIRDAAAMLATRFVDRLDVGHMPGGKAGE